MSLKDSIVIIVEQAKVNFKAYGYLSPVFIGFLDGEPQTIPIPHDKDEFSKQIKEWIGQNRLTEYVMVAEATATPTDGISPQREVAAVIYCNAKEEIHYTADLIRGIIPELGKWNVTSNKVQFNQQDFSARFQGLFLRGKAGQN